MGGFIQFIFATVLIVGCLVLFAVILAAGWLVGTIYLWAEGAAPGPDKQTKRLTWWNREE